MQGSNEHKAKFININAFMHSEVESDDTDTIRPLTSANRIQGCDMVEPKRSSRILFNAFQVLLRIELHILKEAVEVAELRVGRGQLHRREVGAVEWQQALQFAQLQQVDEQIAGGFEVADSGVHLEDEVQQTAGVSLKGIAD